MLLLQLFDTHSYSWILPVEHIGCCVQCYYTPTHLLNLKPPVMRFYGHKTSCEGLWRYNSPYQTNIMVRGFQEGCVPVFPLYGLSYVTMKTTPSTLINQYQQLGQQHNDDTIFLRWRSFFHAAVSCEKELAAKSAVENIRHWDDPRESQCRQRADRKLAPYVSHSEQNISLRPKVESNPIKLIQRYNNKECDIHYGGTEKVNVSNHGNDSQVVTTTIAVEMLYCSYQGRETSWASR